MDGRIVKGIWIPIEIWEAQDLSWNEKILLMEVDSFTSQGKDCYISDEYIADLLKVSERTARTLLSDLIEKGYIARTRFDGRRRFLESTMHIAFAEQSGKICRAERQNLPNTIHHLLIEEDKSSLINNNKKPSRFDFLNALGEIGVSEPVARDWMQVRKELKAANTETAFRSIEREIRKSGMSAEECITMAVENSWRGFKAEWAMNKRLSGRSSGKKVSVLENNMSVAEELMRMSINMGGKL
jgi:DNA-binding MarR family transcriptional regulator